MNKLLLYRHIDFIDHTGDTGLDIRADSLEDVFRYGALGMFEIIAPGNDFKPREKMTVALEGADTEELLVNWLSELNVLLQTESFALAEIESLKIEHNRLKALVSGEEFDPERHSMEVEIKAVTYHMLKIEKTTAGWTARVIFDI